MGQKSKNSKYVIIFVGAYVPTVMAKNGEIAIVVNLLLSFIMGHDCFFFFFFLRQKSYWTTSWGFLILQSSCLKHITTPSNHQSSIRLWVSKEAKNGGMVDDFIRISIDRVSQQFLSYSVSNLTLNLLHKNLSHDKQVVAKVDNTLSLLHRVPVFFPIFTGKNTYTYTSAHTDLFLWFQ